MPPISHGTKKLGKPQGTTYSTGREQAKNYTTIEVKNKHRGASNITNSTRNECMNQSNFHLTARYAIKLSKRNRIGEIISKDATRSRPPPQPENTDQDVISVGNRSQSQISLDTRKYAPKWEGMLQEGRTPRGRIRWRGWNGEAVRV